MDNEDSAMPTALKVVIGLFLLNLCVYLYELTIEPRMLSAWIRVALTVGILVGLLRGNESMRGIVCTLAVIGGTWAAFTVLRLVPHLGGLPPSLVVIGMGSAAFGVAAAIYTFVVLGQERVIVWMLRRSLR